MVIMSDACQNSRHRLLTFKTPYPHDTFTIIHHVSVKIKIFYKIFTILL